MKTPQLIALAAVALLLSGCATPVPLYHPRLFASDSGYSETKLGEAQYRVTFRGDAKATRETVEDLLLLRAAELSRDAGHSHFAITETDTDLETDRRLAFLPVMRGRRAHGDRGSPDGFPYYADGYEWTDRRIAPSPPRDHYVAVAYIELVDAPPTDRRGSTFDAASLIDAIGPLACPNGDASQPSSCWVEHDHDEE